MEPPPHLGEHGPPIGENDLVRVCSDACQKVSCGVEGRVVRVLGTRVHLQSNNLQLHDVPVSVVKRVKDLVQSRALETLRVSTAARSCTLAARVWLERTL